MDVEKIENFEEVLKGNLEGNKELTSYRISRLTAPGDNYGSLMLQLDIKILDRKSEVEEHLQAVAKMLPPNAILRELFNVQVTFTLEISFYNSILPVLREFEKEQQLANPIDIFPKLYGARINLDPKSKIVDDNAILMLENLKAAGFTTVERTVGFDYETTLVVLKDLANFHALPMALKLKKPEVFNKQIMPHISGVRLNHDDIKKMVLVSEKIVKENEECLPHFKKVQQIFQQPYPEKVREPWATIIHNDFWTCNTMIRFDNNKAVASKMVDFQLIEYRPACRDLLFFLFTSVKLNVLKENLDTFLDFYYTNFVKKLKELNCDISLFPEESYQNELALCAKEYEFFHIMFMLPGITKKCKIKELNEISWDDMRTDEKLVTMECKEKLWYITLEFAKRGWLY